MSRRLTARPRRTPRLELRPFRRRDLDSLLVAIDDSMEQLQMWLPWAHEGYGKSEAVRFIRDSAAAWVEGRAYDFAIRRIDRPQVPPRQHLDLAHLEA